MDVAELEKRLEEGEQAESTQAQQEADNAEDFWSPVSAPLSVGSVDDYGALQPVPAHDGTECLKWDDSLWSHADHFKVCCSAIDVAYLRSLGNAISMQIISWSAAPRSTYPHLCSLIHDFVVLWGVSVAPPCLKWCKAANAVKSV